MQEYTFSVVVWREDEWWIAQVVEADLCFQARDRDEIRYEVQRGLAVHILACQAEGIDPFGSTAPSKDTLDKAEEGPYTINLRVHGAVVEYDDDSVWRVV